MSEGILYCVHNSNIMSTFVPLPPLSLNEEIKFFDVDDGSSGTMKSPKKSKNRAVVDETFAVSRDVSNTTEPKSKRGRKSKVSSVATLSENDLQKAEEKESSVDTICRPAFTMAQVHKISDKHDFFMVLNNSTPFKDLVDLIHPVLETINFKVVDRNTRSGKRFRGIVINSMDPKKVAMIVARLCVDTIFPDTFPEQEFCIASSTFPDMIKSIEKGSSMEIKRMKGSNDIVIRGFNANMKNNESIISVPTFDRTDEAPQLNILDYKFIIDIELNSLRTLTRIAATTSINAQNIEFKISELVDDTMDQKITKVCISYDGGPNIPKLTKNFLSKTKWNRQSNGQTVITSSDFSEDQYIEEESQMKMVLHEKFTTKYLNLFLKSMDRQTITLRMSPDRPLVIVYPLNGGEDIGYCNFILAPTVKDD